MFITVINEAKLIISVLNSSNKIKSKQALFKVLKFVKWP